MKGQRFLEGIAAAVALVLIVGMGSTASCPAAWAQAPQGDPVGNAFTYQGRLQISDAPYSGACDFQFGLWDDPSGGTQVGSTLTRTNVSVSQGYFTVVLDFGAGRFQGDGRWLEIQVRCPAGGGSYTPLAPRQELTASPYALYARAAPWTGLSGVPAGFADGADNDTTYSAGAGLTLSGTTFSADTATLQRRVNGACSAGYAIRAVADDGTVTCEALGGSSSGWSLTGNAGTTPSTNYLGTSDNQALVFKVNGLRALRLEPNATSPNLIGGYSGNWVTAGAHAATISGGGSGAERNRVTDDYGTVGGGMANQAGDGLGSTDNASWATVGGGFNNTASGYAATVGGGRNSFASSENATVGGGLSNTAIGYAATVGGGAGNTAGPGANAMVPGGMSNTAAGSWSLAAGTNAKALHDGAFVWADSTGSEFASTAANQFAIRASGGVTMVVSTGAWRIQPNATSPNLIGGHGGNTVAAGVIGATIGGGGESGKLNRVTDNYGTVGGGQDNQAGDNTGTVSDAVEATVGGGLSNKASGWLSTVGGGGGNTASGYAATIGGGDSSAASGWHATVGGGIFNAASGSCGTVPGGADNIASGMYSFAAGYRAQAVDDGSFVWADSTDADVATTSANQFVVRAAGGVKILRGASTFSPNYAALQVEQATNAEAGWLYTTGAANWRDVLKLVKHPDGTGNFIEGVAWNGSAVETPKFHINPAGTYTAGSDFAEALPAAGGKGSYGPGDVLVLSGTQPGAVEKCARSYDGTVIGVYSSRPGFLGADKDGATEVRADDIPVAVVGIVTAKVSAENGPIQPGDLLTTSSTPGHAMRCEGLERCFGRTLGKALEALPAGQSTGVIRVLVTLQ
jgi:hypothetical protein